MDPIGSINPRSDSTLLLGLEAQARGHRLYYYTPDTLSWRDGKITAGAHRIQLFADPKNHYKLGDAEMLDLATMDVVLLRQDPPFDMHYITTTYILEQLPRKTLVVNNPASVRDYPEKLFPTLFRQFMPPTLISTDIHEIEHFRKEQKDIVIKPLYGFGGNDVVRIAPGDNLAAELKKRFAVGREPLMLQRFLPEVKTGDRRIILIDGEIAAVVGRIPAEGEIRANLRLGGTATKAELTPRQRDICKTIAPLLREKGLIFAGVDVIGDWLTEVNLTSPTTLVAANQLTGKKLESDIWDAIERRMK